MNQGKVKEARWVVEHPEDYTPTEIEKCRRIVKKAERETKYDKGPEALRKMFPMG